MSCHQFQGNGHGRTLPALYKLKRLELNCWTFGEIVDEMEACLFFGDEKGGIIDYPKHFPILQSLTILNSNTLKIHKYDGPISFENLWKSHVPFFTPFFPSDKKICKTLVQLNIPYADKENEEMICPIIDEISALFPHVHNKWMNQVRNSLKVHQLSRQFH